MAEVVTLIADSKIGSAILQGVGSVLNSQIAGAFKATFTDSRVAIPFLASWPAGEVALVVHSLATAVFVRRLVSGRQHSWLLHVLAFLFINFSGKAVETLLMAVPLGWIASDRSVGVSLVCWWIVNCSPMDVIGKFLSYGPVNLLLDACDSLIRANAILRGFEMALKYYPGSILAFFFIGVACGCSRALVTDAYRFFMGDPDSRSQLSVPTWPIKSAFYCALVYCALADPFNWIFPTEAEKTDPNIINLVVKLFLVSSNLMQPFTRGASPPPLNILEFAATFAFGLQSAEYRSRSKRATLFASRSSGKQTSQKSSSTDSSSSAEYTKEKKKGKKSKPSRKEAGALQE